MQQTALNNFHKRHGGKMVDFGGWGMPINYGSQIDEHHAVRRDAGLFDVSHMTIVDIEGADAKQLLLKLLANDVNILTLQGKALYSCMLNEAGGVIDDLIVYFLDDGRYRIISNAATKKKDLSWMQQQAEGMNLSIACHSDLSILALQGPNAIGKYLSQFPQYAEATHGLVPFQAVEIDGVMIAKTGYTGEQGLEIALPSTGVESVAEQLHSNGFQLIGLAARDTLRLEAGMALYGNDLNDGITPLEVGLNWTVKFDHDFIGKSALQAQQQQGIPHKSIGIELIGKGVLRAHQTVVDATGKTGEITSGSYSPTLEKSIAMAMVQQDFDVDNFTVEIRNKPVEAKYHPLPFVRKGKPMT